MIRHGRAPLRGQGGQRQVLGRVEGVPGAAHAPGDEQGLAVLADDDGGRVAPGDPHIEVVSVGLVAEPEHVALVRVRPHLLEAAAEDRGRSAARRGHQAPRGLVVCLLQREHLGAEGLRAVQINHVDVVDPVDTSGNDNSFNKIWLRLLEKYDKHLDLLKQSLKSESLNSLSATIMVTSAVISFRIGEPPSPK